MRTSRSHPLRIDAVRFAPRFGRIGMTFCPGKIQANAATGAWSRDLVDDLNAIRDWNAAAVVTLLEDHEMDTLGVRNLGDEVRRRHMLWYHLPIADGCAPTPQFEISWKSAGTDLRGLLRNGFDVVVHCKGGLGRAGTIAARLLAEIGVAAEEAIEAVRTARPGAIETAAQESHILSLKPAAERRTDTSLKGIRDRAIGAFVGLAIGDAVGTTLEFSSRDARPLLVDMIGGGPFKLRPGQWTDDTSMALALADSLLHDPLLDERDLMRRFAAWRFNGDYSCTGVCFDIGNTVAAAITRWGASGNPIAGAVDPLTAGNGSLMRLAPVATRFWNAPEQMVDVARRQGRTTHGAPAAVEACVTFAKMLSDVIRGEPLDVVLENPTLSDDCELDRILKGSWRGKPRREQRASGYVLHSLEAALWSAGRTGDFEQGILAAANLGEDADTTAAITGQLVGAAYGLSGIPAAWLERLAWRERILTTAGRLFDQSLENVAGNAKIHGTEWAR